METAGDQVTATAPTTTAAPTTTTFTAPGTGIETSKKKRVEEARFEGTLTDPSRTSSRKTLSKAKVHQGERKNKYFTREVLADNRQIDYGSSCDNPVFIFIQELSTKQSIRSMDRNHNETRRRKPKRSAIVAFGTLFWQFFRMRLAQGEEKGFVLPFHWCV